MCQHQIPETPVPTRSYSEPSLSWSGQRRPGLCSQPQDWKFTAGATLEMLVSPPWQNSGNICGNFRHEIVCKAHANKPISLLAWPVEWLLCSQLGRDGGSAVACRKPGVPHSGWRAEGLEEMWNPESCGQPTFTAYSLLILSYFSPHQVVIFF